MRNGRVEHQQEDRPTFKHEVAMDCWDWEFFESAMTDGGFVVSDQGPLRGPVTEFSIIRDKALDLILETTSAPGSKSNAAPPKAGTVYIATAEVQFQSHFGTLATACGVIPRAHTQTFGRDASTGTTHERSSIHSLHWVREDSGDAQYIIEWVENMSGPFIWPDFDKVERTGEKRRTLKSQKGEIVMSVPIYSPESSRSCVHLFIEGFELFIGVSKAKPEHILKPGFILYRGTPDEPTRAKIRDCLSFCLGNFLVYLGDTTFDAEWNPVSFSARSGHALVEDAANLNAWQPAPLGTRFEHEITPELLERMASSLYRIYDAYRLQSVFWSYWHALAAPVHMVAAHFGAAIESLQKAFFKASGSEGQYKIVADDKSWKDLSKKISALISATDLTEAEKRLLTGKAQNINYAPQGIVMEKLFKALGLKIDALENEVWVNRNRAAHGGGVDPEKGSRLVRENKVLHLMMNRILLAIGNGSDQYYDYYTIGRPSRRLSDPIQDDRNEG